MYFMLFILGQMCEGIFFHSRQHILDQRGFKLGILDQEFRREGWTETAVIVCKLNKSL